MTRMLCAPLMAFIVEGMFLGASLLSSLYCTPYTPPTAWDAVCPTSCMVPLNIWDRLCLPYIKGWSVGMKVQRVEVMCTGREVWSFAYFMLVYYTASCIVASLLAGSCRLSVSKTRGMEIFVTLHYCIIILLDHVTIQKCMTLYIHSVCTYVCT